MKSLTMFLESDSYFHKFQFSYWFKSFHVKCRPTVTLQSIGGFGLNFLNSTPLVENPGSATEPDVNVDIALWLKRILAHQLFINFYKRHFKFQRKPMYMYMFIRQETEGPIIDA